ncbi:cation:proton antiporter [Streptococcus iniae]
MGIWFDFIIYHSCSSNKVIARLLCRKKVSFFQKDSLTIGGGMVSRGEMALIIVQIGLAEKLISNAIYSSLVIVVILSTIIAPFILKISFKEAN